MMFGVGMGMAGQVAAAPARPLRHAGGTRTSPGGARRRRRGYLARPPPAAAAPPRPRRQAGQPPRRQPAPGQARSPAASCGTRCRRCPSCHARCAKGRSSATPAAPRCWPAAPTARPSSGPGAVLRLRDASPPATGPASACRTPTLVTVACGGRARRQTDHGPDRVPVVQGPERAGPHDLRHLRRAARRAGPGHRLGVDRGAPAAGPDGVRVLQLDLPGRREIVPGGRAGPGRRATGCSSSTTSCSGRSRSLAISAMDTGGGIQRMVGGMPHFLNVATGPGRIAVLPRLRRRGGRPPAAPGMEIDVRDHAFLAGTHSLHYSFVRLKGLANMLHGGDGMFMDRFVTPATPASCSCTAAATSSNGRSAPARRSWSSRGRSSTRTPPST